MGHRSITRPELIRNSPNSLRNCGGRTFHRHYLRVLLHRTTLLHRPGTSQSGTSLSHLDRSSVSTHQSPASDRSPPSMTSAVNCKNLNPNPDAALPPTQTTYPKRTSSGMQHLQQCLTSKTCTSLVRVNKFVHTTHLERRYQQPRSLRCPIHCFCRTRRERRWE